LPSMCLALGLKPSTVNNIPKKKNVFNCNKIVLELGLEFFKENI
jgi:hypothetical protein